MLDNKKNAVVYPDGHVTGFKTPEEADAEIEKYNDNCDPGEPRAMKFIGEVR